MKRFWMTLALLLWAVPALAQVAVIASVRPQQVALGDPVEFSVTVQGESSGIDQPEPPDSPDLDVVASGSTTNFQFINGKASRSMTFTFTVRPTKEGDLTIPAVTVRVKGKPYATEPVPIKVLPASSRSRAQQPQGRSPFGSPFGGIAPFGGMDPFGAFGGAQGVQAGDVAIDATVDNPAPYVGEQVIFTFTLDRQVDLFEANYTPPDFTGLRNFPLQPPPDGESRVEMRNGRRHVILSRRVALFPVQPGEAAIGPAALDFTVNPFAGGQHLQTKPVTLNVKPLPQAGRPDGYAGAVGNLRLTANLAPQSVNLGDAATLTVTVSGRGNLQDIASVILPDLPDAEVYDPEVADHFDQGPDGLSGVRELRYVIIPRQGGTLSVGDVTLPVFDPKAGAYKLLRADGGTVTVTGAPVPAAPTTAGTPSPGRGREAAAPELGHGVFVWIEGGAILAALGGLMWFSRRAGRQRAPEPEPEAPAAPDRRATQAALDGAASIADHDACLRAVERAVCEYLGGIWGVAPAQVVAALARERLADRPELADPVVDLLDSIGMARYAPGGVAVAREEVLAAARSLVASFPEEV